MVGFNPGDAGTNSDPDYLLIDWRRLDQNFNFVSGSNSPGGTAKRGLAVSRVTGSLDYDELWQHKNLSGTAAGSGVTELARGSTLSDTGYSVNTEYTFTIDFGRYGLKVYVDGGLELDIPGDFTDGRFGFYQLSQENVVFKNVHHTVGSFTKTQTVSFDKAEYVAWEGDPITVVVNLDVDLAAALSVPITFTDDADDPPESGDYTNPLTNNILTIAADGDTEWDSASFTITNTSDSDADHEKLTLSFGTVAGDVKNGPSATVTIAERATPGQSSAATLEPTADGFAVSWDPPSGAYATLTTYTFNTRRATHQAGPTLDTVAPRLRLPSADCKRAPNATCKYGLPTALGTSEPGPAQRRERFPST